MHLDIRESRDNLVLGRELGALLELEIANGAGQGEVAVHAAEVNESAGGLDTGLLGCGELAEAVYTDPEDVPSFWGLWSYERGFARPLIPSTLRESPAFACIA